MPLLLLHIPLCKRIIAQAVFVSLRQKQVVTTSKFSCASPCMKAQKNRSCKYPSFRSSRYLEITCPSCTWRLGSARRPRSPWRFPTCKLSLVRCSGTSVFPTGRPRRDTHTGHMPKVWCWPRSVRRRSWPWHRNPIYQSLNREMGPGAVGSLATPLRVVRCQPNVTCAHVGASVWLVAAVAAPRPLFITSWCLRATCRRFRPHREECLRSSFSLVLPLSFLVACLRPFSPACHRRGRRHHSACASSAVTRWSISLTYPLRSFKRICLRVKLVPQEGTSMRIDEQITNKSSKTSIKVTTKRACCNAQRGRSCTCPFHSSWE